MACGYPIARKVLLLPAVLVAVLTVFPCPGLSASLDVVLVLDQSGSMKQNDPQRLLVSAAADFVAKLGARDAAGLVVFGGQATVALPLARLDSEANRTALHDAIRRIRYSDPWTNMAAGIERGLYELKMHGQSRATPVLIFITDGIVDLGSEARNAEMRDWLRSRLLPEARERGVKIFSVALTEQADYPLIQEMAVVTGGDYFRALGVQEIAGIFSRIIARLQAPPPPVPPTPLPAPPAQPPATVLTAAWFWTALLGALALMGVGGLIAIRRRHAAGPSAGMRQASQATVIGKAWQVEPVPEAYLRDGRTGKRTRLSKPLVRIGRAPDSDLVVAEPQISSRHAEIECRGGRFYLRDLRSTNGTWVNRKRVQDETVLKSGDTVAFDEFLFTFTLAESAPAETMIRDLADSGLPRGTQPTEAARAPGGAGTMVMGTDATLNDAAGPPRCPTHPHLEATERCDVCGKLWCALCNPPVPAGRVCRTCREERRASGRRPGDRPDVPAAAG